MSHLTRYFFAVFPDAVERETALGRANELQYRLKLDGNRVLKNRLNITVQFIGTFDGAREDVERRALEVGATMTGLGGPITMDWAMRFDGDYGKNSDYRAAMFYPAAVPQAWREASERIRDAFNWLPALPDLPPHVTFIYTDDSQLDSPASIAPMAWCARELCLVRSVQGSNHYEILCRWAL